MTFAIIAHDGKKPEMVTFLLNIKDQLKGINLLATSTTGSHLEEMGLDVQKMMSGPLGGDAQIAAQVAQNKVDAVFFFVTLWESILTNLMCKCYLDYAMYTTFH